MQAPFWPWLPDRQPESGVQIVMQRARLQICAANAVRIRPAALGCVVTAIVAMPPGFPVLLLLAGELAIRAGPSCTGIAGGKDTKGCQAGQPGVEHELAEGGTPGEAGSEFGSESGVEHFAVHDGPRQDGARH